MKTSKKTIIVVFLLMAAIGLSYIFWQNRWPSDMSDQINLGDTVAKLQSLNIMKQDVPDHLRLEYQDEFEEAKQALNDAYEKHDDNDEDSLQLLYWPLMSLGNLNRNVEDFKKAELAFLQVTEISPNGYVPLGSLADLYFRSMNEYAKAEQYFLRAIENDNVMMEQYYSELHTIYRYHLEDQAKAEQILLQGMERHPELTNILAKLARYYRETDRLDQAIDRYEELLEIKPDSKVAMQALEKLVK